MMFLVRAKIETRLGKVSQNNNLSIGFLNSKKLTSIKQHFKWYIGECNINEFASGFQATTNYIIPAYYHIYMRYMEIFICNFSFFTIGNILHILSCILVFFDICHKWFPISIHLSYPFCNTVALFVCVQSILSRHLFGGYSSPTRILLIKTM